MTTDRTTMFDVDVALAENDLETLGRLRDDPRFAEHIAAFERAEVPDWAYEVTKREQQKPARRGGSRGSGPRWWHVAAPALAMAAALLLYVGSPSPDPDEPYVGTKGEPTAVLYVQDADGRVQLWDGAEPLGAGDRFRVELADLDEPYFVLVYDEPDEPPVVLAHGVVEGLVEGAWTFDGPARGAELQVFGFAAQPTEPEEAWRGRQPDVILELR